MPCRIDAGFGWLAGRGGRGCPSGSSCPRRGARRRRLQPAKRRGGKKRGKRPMAVRKRHVPRAKEGGRWPRGDSRRARPTVRFPAEREVGPSVGKTCLETRARRPESSRARVGGEIARAVAHELCAGALARAGHLERARDRRDRDGPRETKSRPTGIASTRRTNPSKNPSTAWSVKHPACVPCGNARATRATKRIMVVARMVTCAATSARRKHAAEEFE